MRWWIKLIFALALIAALVLLGWAMVRGIGGLLGGAELSSEPDPMFAEEASLPTRPPEMDAEEAAPEHATLDDYVPEAESPVDKTADELIREAEARAGA